MMFCQRLMWLCTHIILLNTLLTDFFPHLFWLLYYRGTRERNHVTLNYTCKWQKLNKKWHLEFLAHWVTVFFPIWYYILSGHFILNICTIQFNTTAGHVSTKHDTFLTVFVYYWGHNLRWLYETLQYIVLRGVSVFLSSAFTYIRGEEYWKRL